MPYVLIVQDEDRTHRFPLADGEHVLGSSPESDVRLTHPTVSRRHARIAVADGVATVEDLGSSNGTKVAGKLVSGRQPVASGALLVFGSLEGRLETIDAADLEPGVVFEDEAGEEAETSDEAEAGADSGASPALGTTIGVGSFRQFALVELGEILDRVGRGGSVAVAQTAGAALDRSLPGVGVTIRRAGIDGEAGVVFASGAELAADDGGAVIECEAGELSLRVAFSHATQARAYRPLVQAVARLLELGDDLAGRRRPTPSAKPDPAAPPPLPEPPTVEREVRSIYSDAAKVGEGEVSVLISGDSGTGKEVLARYLHAASPRRDEAFVALNCAALPRDLLEAELFGIEKGVATGVESRPGKFELADGGTLFLDEIGDMAPETQAKILRVLQEREVYRLGSTEPKPARVRVLAATNRDLDRMLADGDFRTDLYHRIADWRVRLPALAERPGDIPNLAAYFLEREAKKRGVKVAGISQGALAVLLAFPWPGNIRQLEREMARAALFLDDGELLQTRHLQPEIKSGAAKAPAGARHGTLKQRLEEVERREIEAALAANDGNMTATARELGIGRSTLYRRIEELGIG